MVVSKENTKKNTKFINWPINGRKND